MAAPGSPDVLAVCSVGADVSVPTCSRPNAGETCSVRFPKTSSSQEGIERLVPPRKKAFAAYCLPAGFFQRSSPRSKVAFPLTPLRS